jgi:hypothetical protein
MWLDCGDGLQENAVAIINTVIHKSPDKWLHLDGFYISHQENRKVRMSSKSYMPYLKKVDQFIPFCLSVSTYGHFVIPFRVYKKLNPSFELVDGFYYDAQVVGALSLNNYPQYFIKKALSIIDNDQHFSVINSSRYSYRNNLLTLAEYIVPDLDMRERISRISLGIGKISIRQFFSSGKYFANRAKLLELNNYYKSNDIKLGDRYRWFALLITSILYLDLKCGRNE